MIDSLVTDDRCGIAKIQVCPPSQSYTSSDSQYFDQEYKNWADEDDKILFDRVHLISNPDDQIQI